MDQEKKMNIWEIAEYLFGPMRTSTDEELELERQMMQRLSKNAEPFGKISLMMTFRIQVIWERNPIWQR